MVKRVADLREMIDALAAAYGRRHWWPAETPFEVMVGAILTQNTAWSNVELAINNLREADLLDARKMAALPLEELQRMIRPAGFFKQKARKLRGFLDWFLGDWNGSIEELRDGSPGEIREQLLALWGIGPETADAILCYALDKPVFVVDAYTIRVMSRHDLIDENAGYDAVQRFALERLPRDHAYLNEAHAVLVEVGKRRCRRSSPDCAGCPLEPFLP